MKPILTPSAPSYRPRVAISGPYDGSNIQDVIDTLVTPALIAFGFQPSSIRDGYENAEIPQEAPRREPELEYWETPSEPPYPELPPVPAGYSGWTLPRLCSEVGERRDVNGVMAFFHTDGKDEDWIITRDGTYGKSASDRFAYPIYYVHAI